MNITESLNTEELLNSFNSLGIFGYIVGILLMLVIALFGYKLQKLCISIGAGFGVGAFMVHFLSTMISDQTTVYISSIIIGLIVFVVILAFYIKIIAFAVALAGAGVAFMTLGPIVAQKMTELIGDTVPAIDIISKIVVALIAATICGVLAKFVFKWLVIVLTSFGGAAGVALDICIWTNQQVNALFIALALVLGVACCIFQIKRNKNSN